MSKRVTKSEAVAEIARRSEPKGSDARKAYPRPEVMRLTGPELAALAGPSKPAPEPKPERKPEPDPRKALARKVSERAAASAPDGHRVAAKIRAHKAMLGGSTVQEALAAARETVRQRVSQQQASK